MSAEPTTEIAWAGKQADDAERHEDYDAFWREAKRRASRARSLIEVQRMSPGLRRRLTREAEAARIRAAEISARRPR